MTIAKYFTPTGSNTVKRSAYGSRGVQAEVRALTRAKVMNVGGRESHVVLVPCPRADEIVW
jgi:hypothetical protein